MNPLSLYNKINDKLPNLKQAVCQTEKLSGYKLHVKDSKSREAFLKTFKEAELGPRAKIIVYNEKRSDNIAPVTKTYFFLCYQEHLHKYESGRYKTYLFKQRIPITNVVRIENQ